MGSKFAPTETVSGRASNFEIGIQSKGKINNRYGINEEMKETKAVDDLEVEIIRQTPAVKKRSKSGGREKKKRKASSNAQS